MELLVAPHNEVGDTDRGLDDEDVVLPVKRKRKSERQRAVSVSDEAPPRIPVTLAARLLHDEHDVAALVPLFDVTVRRCHL
jgi:hypothetical protein